MGALECMIVICHSCGLQWRWPPTGPHGTMHTLSTISAVWQHADLSGSYLQDLAGKAEEVMDLLGTYFPILYTQPSNMPRCVTRVELATAVEQALAAVPVFAPHVIPLLLEKLSSSIRWGLQAFQWLIKVTISLHGISCKHWSAHEEK